MYNSLKIDGIRRYGRFLPEKSRVHNKLLVLSIQQIVMDAHEPGWNSTVSCESLFPAKALSTRYQIGTVTKKFHKNPAVNQRQVDRQSNTNTAISDQTRPLKPMITDADIRA